MEYNTHMDLKEIYMGWNGIIWFKTGRSDGFFFCKYGNEILGSVKSENVLTT
jgi:hypothetical protein